MGRKSCVIIVESGMPRRERCQSGDGGCMPWVRLRERLEINLKYSTSRFKALESQGLHEI
jgi:hypothetical protein